MFSVISNYVKIMFLNSLTVVYKIMSDLRIYL